MRALFFILLFVSHAGAMRNPVPVALSSTTVSYLAEWDASPDPNARTYHLHFGTSPGVYTQTIDAGSSLFALMPNLAADTTYYVIANAVNSVGVEGLPTPEVFAGPRPSPSPTATPTPTPGTITVLPASLNFTGPGQSLDLQITTSTGADWTSDDNSPWFDGHPTTGASGARCTYTSKVASNYPAWTISISSPGSSTRVINAVMTGSSPTPSASPSPLPTIPPTPTATPAISPTPRPPTPSPTVKPVTPTPPSYILSVSPATGNLPATGGAITFTVTLTPKP